MAFGSRYIKTVTAAVIPSLRAFGDQRTPRCLPRRSEHLGHGILECTVGDDHAGQRGGNEGRLGLDGSYTGGAMTKLTIEVPDEVAERVTDAALGRVSRPRPS